MPENWLKIAMEKARKRGRRYFALEEPFLPLALLLLEGFVHGAQFGIDILFPDGFKNGAGFGGAALAGEPARAARDSEQHQEEQSGGQG